MKNAARIIGKCLAIGTIGLVLLVGGLVASHFVLPEKIQGCLWQADNAGSCARHMRDVYAKEYAHLQCDRLENESDAVFNKCWRKNYDGFVMPAPVAGR